MKNMQELSDIALTGYLEKMVRALSKIAVARGIRLDVYADEDGGRSVRVGDYAFFALTPTDRGTYRYAPLKAGKSWRELTEDEIK